MLTTFSYDVAQYLHVAATLPRTECNATKPAFRLDREWSRVESDCQKLLLLLLFIVMCFVMKQVDEIVSSGKFGDLIEFSYPIGYSHWGVYDGDGNVVHFAVTDQGQLLSRVRNSLQQMFPVCGDLLLGETRIRRVPLRDVNVPKGAQVFVSNNRHAFTPSASQEMRLRCNALIGHEFPYHLFNFNCEHFATFVRYGKAVCNQIPLRRKNLECLEATTTFSNIVSSKETAQDDSATATFSNIVSSKETAQDDSATATFNNIVSSKEAAQDDSATTTFNNIVSTKEAAQDDSATTTFSNIVSSKEAAQDDSATTTFSNIVSSKEAAQDDST